MPEPELQKPVASFSANVQTGEAPLTVVFTNTSTGTIIGYSWSFGDGTFSQDKDPTHIYADAGNYTVSLTVFNEAGGDASEYRIDATAADATTLPDRNETINDLIPSIRSVLRRPSDAKLSYRDIMDVLTDLLRGYSRDLHVAEQSHRTDEGQCTLSYLDGSNYLLTIPGVADVEAMALRFALATDVANATQDTIWREVTIVPIDYYTERHTRDAAVCSFFGGMIVENGLKIKINLSREQVEQSVWTIRYRVPFLRLLTLASKTALPADFIPMLKMEAAMMCLPRMRDDSSDFYAWRKANEPIFAASIGNWRGRWKDFLETSTEPNYSPKMAANDYRAGNRRRRGQFTVIRGTPT